MPKVLLQWKDLLLELSLPSKGVFQLFGVVAIIYLSFAIGWNIVRTFPSCGFVYYLINAIIAFVGIVAHMCCSAVPVSKERDEPDNIYRYAEEYYANTQDESSYGYNNEDDSLNVHTINYNNN